LAASLPLLMEWWKLISLASTTKKKQTLNSFLRRKTNSKCVIKFSTYLILYFYIFWKYMSPKVLQNYTNAAIWNGSTLATTVSKGRRHLPPYEAAATGEAKHWPTGAMSPLLCVNFSLSSAE
jgi:hypothetical protein